MTYENIDLKNLDILLCADYYGLECKKSTANTYKAACTFHNDKSPSLVFYANSNTYNCFGCGANGNVANFVMQKENIEFVAALKLIRQIYELDSDKQPEQKLPRQKPILEKIAEQPKEITTQFHSVYSDLLAYCATIPNKQAKEYLTNERNLQADILKIVMIQTFEGAKLQSYLQSKYSPAELQSFGLVSAKNYFYFTNYQIVIPYFHNNKIANLQFRTLRPDKYNRKYMFLGINATLPYNLDNLIFLADERIAITEGVFDCLTIYQLNKYLLQEQGFACVIALPSASIISKELFSTLKTQNLHVTCFIDKDKAGKKATEKITSIVNDLNFKVDFFEFDNFKDVNEFYSSLIK